MAILSGEPKAIAKSTESALAAMDANYNTPAQKNLDALEEYRASLGVKKRAIGDPKFTVNSNYQRFNDAALFQSSVKDWYVTNKDKATVPADYYTRFAALEQQNGITLANDASIKSKAAADNYDKPGWTLLDYAFAGAIGTISGAVTFKAQPGRSNPNNLVWPTSVNQAGLGYMSWYDLKTPTYQSMKLPKYEVTDPSLMSHIVKKTAMMFGWDEVGITTLDRRWVWTTWYDSTYTHTSYPVYFTDEPGCPTDENGQAYTVPTVLDDGTEIIPKEMNNVIAFHMGEQTEFYDTCPEEFYAVSNGRAYSKAAVAGSMMATFIRNLGYNAIPMLNDSASHIPMVIEAGLSEQSRIDARTVSPEFGALCRAYAMFTDLPLAPDNPIDFQLSQFCQECKKCATNCPGHALSMETDMTDGSEPNDVGAPLDLINTTGKTTYYGNRLKCDWGASTTGGGCAICKRSCPWNHKASSLHNDGKWAAINLGGVGRGMLLDMYEAFGYGQELPATKWWDKPVIPISGYTTIEDTS